MSEKLNSLLEQLTKELQKEADNGNTGAFNLINDINDYKSGKDQDKLPGILESFEATHPEITSIVNEVLSIFSGAGI